MHQNPLANLQKWPKAHLAIVLVEGDKDLQKLISTRKRLKQNILTYSEYLELFNSIGVNLRQTHDMSLIDDTVRKFFLNLTIKRYKKDGKQGYKITHELKKPWTEFVKTDNFDRGRGDRT